jgi:hypothetical protein
MLRSTLNDKLDEENAAKDVGDCSRQPAEAVAYEKPQSDRPSFVACTLGDILAAQKSGLLPSGRSLSMMSLENRGSIRGISQRFMLPSSNASAAPPVVGFKRPVPAPASAADLKRTQQPSGKRRGRPSKPKPPTDNDPSVPKKRRGRPPGKKNKIRYGKVPGPSPLELQPDAPFRYTRKAIHAPAGEGESDAAEEVVSPAAPDADVVPSEEDLPPCGPLATAPKALDITSVYNHYLPMMQPALTGLVTAVLDTGVPFPPAGGGWFSAAAVAALPEAARDAARIEVLQQRVEWVVGELTAAGIVYGWGKSRAPAHGSDAFLRGVALKYARDRLRGRIHLAAKKGKDGAGEQGAGQAGQAGLTPTAD